MLEALVEHVCNEGTALPSVDSKLRRELRKSDRRIAIHIKLFDHSGSGLFFVRYIQAQKRVVKLIGGEVATAIHVDALEDVSEHLLLSVEVEAEMEQDCPRGLAELRRELIHLVDELYRTDRSTTVAVHVSE